MKNILNELLLENVYFSEMNSSYFKHFYYILKMLFVRYNENISKFNFFREYTFGTYWIYYNLEGKFDKLIIQPK